MKGPSNGRPSEVIDLGDCATGSFRPLRTVAVQSPSRRQKFEAATRPLVAFKDDLAHSHIERGPVLGCLKCDTNLVLAALDNLKRRHFK